MSDSQCKLHVVMLADTLRIEDIIASSWASAPTPVISTEMS